MKARSTMISTHRDDGSRLSSSLPQPVLSLGDTSASSQSPNAPFPSSRSRRGQSTTLNESILAQRTAAQRQLRGTQKPLLQRFQEFRDSKQQHINGRSSTLASQPVLVKAYTPETDDARNSTNMSNSAAQQVDLPSVEEFGIEAILRAIEPDIRSTLDSIAEICGRSKLSLANEYGSHIAPFGEVHHPSGELLAIQESATTSNTERTADVDGHIVIANGDNDLYGPPLGLLDDLRQTAFATGYQRTIRAETQETQTRRGNYSSKHGTHPPAAMSIARVQEFAATSKPGSKALLGNGNGSAKAKATNKPASNGTMASPALLSETHLDAQGNRSSWPSEPPDTPQTSPIPPATSYVGNRSGHSQNTKVDRMSLVADIQDWLGWLKMIIQREKTNQETFHAQSHSAEYSLRTLLVKDQDRAIPVPTA